MWSKTLMVGTREQIRFPAGQSFRFLRWDENCRDVELVLAPGKAAMIHGEGTHWHYHPEMELAFFESGEGTRYVGDSIEGFHAGDLVLLGENLPHLWQVAETCRGCSIQWRFPPNHVFWMLPELSTLEGLFRRTQRGIRYFGRTGKAASSMLSELSAYDGAERFAMFVRLLSMLAKAPGSDWKYVSRRQFALASGSRHQTSMRDAVHFLFKNYTEEVHLPNLLRELGMTKPTFSRHFKRHSGKTFSEFLQHVRLQQVCRDLKETDEPVTKIALACGFTQISFFNRVFRRSFACSPLEYRRRHQGRGRPAPSTDT